jgi:hypothetical protein
LHCEGITTHIDSVEGVVDEIARRGRFACVEGAAAAHAASTKAKEPGIIYLFIFVRL